MVTLKSWFSIKRMPFFLLAFWSMMLVVSGGLFALNSAQVGMAQLLRHSSGLYLFLVLLATILKIFFFIYEWQHKKALWGLLIVEALSLNVLTILPIYLLSKHAQETSRMTRQSKLIAVCLGIVLCLQVTIYLGSL